MNPLAKSCAIQMLTEWPDDNVMLAGICKTVARHVWPSAAVELADFSKFGEPEAWVLECWSDADTYQYLEYPDIDLTLTVARALVVVVEGL